MSWRVQKMHQHCKECSECVEAAVAFANETSGTRAESSDYKEGELLHFAIVILKGSISDTPE